MSEPITPLTPAQTAQQEEQTTKDGYFHDLAVDVDDLGNGIAGGHPDETISSRDSRDALEDQAEGKKHAPAELLADVLDDFEKDHGAKAQAGDTERAEEIVALEADSGALNQSAPAPDTAPVGHPPSHIQ